MIAAIFKMKKKAAMRSSFWNDFFFFFLKRSFEMHYDILSSIMNICKVIMNNITVHVMI